MLQKRDDTFREFVLDQLNGPGTIASRAMFGGHGLYRDRMLAARPY
jgi:TfoX/Sxy family transcriptional regulator of competence genes